MPDIDHKQDTYQARFPDPDKQDAVTWKPLRLLTFYRVILAGLLTVLFFGIPESPALGNENPALFGLACIGYLAFSIVAGFTTRMRILRFELQSFIQILADIGAITLLMHASGGIGSGLGILLLIPVAAGSLLLPGRMAFLFAALATIAIMGEQAFRTLMAAGSGAAGYTQTGFLGLALFATAGLTYLLTRRIRVSEALARKRGVDIANLARLNAHIVQRLQAGIIVTDQSGGIRLINDRARALLDSPDAAEGMKLSDISPELDRKMQAWRQTSSSEPSLLESGSGSSGILAHFNLLGTGDDLGALVFLEDMASMTRQARQIKLASLGRLTASIAHEIRNPLGAISHATQLLAESDALEAGDVRLTSIIKDHARRVNTVVENILQLSRPGATMPQRIHLKRWLEKFVEEFTHSGQCRPEQVEIEVAPENIEVYMDPSQLHQVVWNLCQNAIDHGGSESTPARIRCVGSLTGAANRPCLDIIDNGPGIDPEVADQIFEPFFTTRSTGTGLGLYIAREICESNQAQLGPGPDSQRGGCFRITFADTSGLPAAESE